MTEVPDETRRLLRRARTGTLATAMAGSGHPYASLVNVATDLAGNPLFLVSQLAVHTKNIQADARASVMVRDDTPTGSGDALTGMRATVIGTLRRTTDPEVRARYLAAHPASAGYADFADFSFWRMSVESVHVVAGFGRISTFAGEQMLLPESLCRDIAEVASGAIEHMNADHRDAIADYARMAGASPGPWHMSSLDADGFDLILEHRGVRIEFPKTLRNRGDLRPVLIALAQQARGHA